MTARNKEYVIDQIDKAITELVHDKYRLQKAYNYYNGKRDPELFRYLEENFGIGNPTSVEFTPLIKKHVDALVGEYLDIPTIPKVSCKDNTTVSNILRDKKLAIDKALFSFLQNKLNNDILAALQKDLKENLDPSIAKLILTLVEGIEDSFISEYETAAQNVIEYVLQSRSADILNKKKVLSMDLLIAGQAYFRVKPSLHGTNLSIEVFNPLNVFVDKNPESLYVLDSYRVVIRKWMTKQQILNLYGKELDRESKKELDEMFPLDSNYTYVRSHAGEVTTAPMSGDLDNGNGVVPGYPYDDNFVYNLIPVYEVEWIDTDKEGGFYVENRYEGVRIGQSVYIPTGKSENVIRTQDAPMQCKLSVGGIFLVNRDQLPYSLVLQCAGLQDKYDVVMYLRDSILANSGTIGDWVDVSMLPTFLGNEMTERILKWLAYKKTGLAMIDSSQEGRGFNNNTFMAGFDDAAKVQTIQAFDLVLARIEEQTSSITGVFRERLNGINLKDAVTNVAVAARNSFTITKPFYQLLDTLTVDILMNCVDIAKIVWKEGLTGTIVLGDKLQRVFTALPEYFTFTDFDVHIVPTTEILRDMQNMQAIVMEMIKSGVMEPDMATEAMACKSLTELKHKIAKSWKKKKEENNQIQQLGLQLQEALKQLEQLTSENKKLLDKIAQFNEAKLQVEREKNQLELLVKWFLAQTDREYKTKSVLVDEKKVNIELQLLYDGNPYNDKIRYK